MVKKEGRWACRFGRHTWRDWRHGGYFDEVTDDGEWLHWDLQVRSCERCPRTRTRRVPII